MILIATEKSVIKIFREGSFLVKKISRSILQKNGGCKLDIVGLNSCFDLGRHLSESQLLQLPEEIWVLDWKSFKVPSSSSLWNLGPFLQLLYPFRLEGSQIG